MTNMDAGFKRPLDRQPLSRFRGRNASVILLSFYCISLVLIKSVLIKPVLIKSFEMKRPFMVWIGFISICCSKVAKEGKSCPRLLVLQRVAQNAKSCSKFAEHNLFMPTYGRNENSMNRKQVQRERERLHAALQSTTFATRFGIQWGLCDPTTRRQRERQKQQQVQKAKQQLCACISLYLYISLPFLHDYELKLPVNLPNFFFFERT